jgi:hypothetical protein
MPDCVRTCRERLEEGQVGFEGAVRKGEVMLRRVVRCQWDSGCDRITAEQLTSAEIWARSLRMRELTWPTTPSLAIHRMTKPLASLSNLQKS